MRFLAVVPVILCLLSGCMSYDFAKRVVQQGNLLPKKNLDSVSLGMTKEEVLRIMGTSLLSSNFNDDHWNYVYTWRRGNSAIIEKRISFDFKKNVLTRIV